jgi:hypothetical protein
LLASRIPAICALLEVFLRRSGLSHFLHPWIPMSTSYHPIWALSTRGVFPGRGTVMGWSSLLNSMGLLELVQIFCSHWRRCYC